MRALVVGGGSIGTRHLKNLAAVGIEGAGVVEPDEARRRAIVAETGAAGYAFLEDALARQPDFAIICTPTDNHVATALLAAKAGCHLFVEKPLSHSLEGLDELLREARSRSLITLVGCNMRFHPGPAAVKRCLEEGLIGEVLAARIEGGSYLPRWRPGQDYRSSYSASPRHGGAILDYIHELDLALWYLGPARLLAAGALPAHSIGLKTEGLAEILLRHDTGQLSNVHVNFVQQDYHRACQIIGAQGTLRWNFAAQKVTVTGPEGQTMRIIEQPNQWTLNQMYVDELRHFAESVEKGCPTINSLEGGRDALQLALAARSWPLQHAA